MAQKTTGVTAMLMFSFILVLSWSCTAANGEVGGKGSTDVSAQCGRESYTSVFCKNGAFTFGLEQRITEEHGDCEPGIYDKDCAVHLNVGKTVELSRLLKHQNVTLDGCPSEFCLKLQCTDTMNNRAFCFRGVSDTSPDPQSQSSNGSSELWLYISSPVAAVVGLVIGLII